MSARYNYNRQVSPPAPFVYVTIGRPDRSDLFVDDIAAQVDTGADFTVIPSGIVEKLGLVQLDRTMVASFGGHVSLVPTYLIRLAIKDFAASLIQVLANRDEPYVLLGRDVLNRFTSILDGPNLIIEIASDLQK